MSEFIKLKWDNIGERFFEAGVSKTVLYKHNGATYDTGVAWNGIQKITENPSGAEVTPIYADNIKYINVVSTEEFGATIEAYTYPDAFAECDGSSELATGLKIGQQPRSPFGLCYRTNIGNDIVGIDMAYKIHIIYGAVAAPSSRDNGTINESLEAMTFSWEVSTTPVEVAGHKPTAHLEIDSRKISSKALEEIEKKLYGDGATTNPTLLMPDQVLEIIQSNPAL